MLCRPESRCHVKVTANLRKHPELRLHSNAMTPGFWHVSLLPCPHATKGTRTKGQRCPSDEVGHSRKVARTTCLPPRASLVILESMISTASTRRPPRPRSSPPSPPLGLRAAAPTQRAAGGQERTADPRRSRVERHAAHAQGWESGGRASSAGGGGMSGAVGTLTMRRLQAPARHKPGI